MTGLGDLHKQKMVAKPKTYRDPGKGIGDSVRMFVSGCQLITKITKQKPKGCAVLRLYSMGRGDSAKQMGIKGSNQPRRPARREYDPHSGQTVWVLSPTLQQQK